MFNLSSNRLCKNDTPAQPLCPHWLGRGTPQKSSSTPPCGGRVKRNFYPAAARRFSHLAKVPARCWSSQRQKSRGWPFICPPPCRLQSSSKSLLENKLFARFRSSGLLLETSKWFAGFKQTVCSFPSKPSARFRATSLLANKSFA